MNDLLKHPAVLAGALVLGLVIFATSRGKSGSDGRLAAAIESQRIATQGNVQLSGIAAQRDVAMAQAMTTRTAIAAQREVQGAHEINTARALNFSHGETMRGLDISETLGTMQTQAAREIALAGLQRDTYAITKAAEVKHAELSIANVMQQRSLATTEYLAGLSSDLQRNLFSQNAGLLTNPDVLHHTEVLAQIAQTGATQRAQISARAARDTYTQRAATDAVLGRGGSGGGLLDSFIRGAGSFLGSGSGYSGAGIDAEDAGVGAAMSSGGGGDDGGVDWGQLAATAASFLAFA